MKKFLTLILIAAFTFGAALGFAACGDGKSDDKVNLVAIDGGSVGMLDDADYYVVPEPAASAKVGAIESLEFSGDLQQLYGEGGYPQAVIVARNSLLEYSFVGEFLQEVNLGGQWLLSENTSAESIVNAVQSHLTEGMKPTFTAKNLTKTVIGNSGIDLTYSADCKTRILEFMQKLNAVSSGFGTPSDGFFFGGVYPEAEYDKKVTVYAPDGAPALGLARLLAGEAQFTNEVEYRIVEATTIQTYVTGANPKADICVLPVNLAVKLLGSGENYKLVATLTNGNLYLVSKGGEKITADNIGTLKGKTVAVVNLAQVPGLTFKLILKNHGLDFTEIK